MSLEDSFDRLSETAIRIADERNALAKALQQIVAIEDQMIGGDWEEIETAREIARAALTAAGVTP